MPPMAVAVIMLSIWVPAHARNRERWPIVWHKSSHFLLRTKRHDCTFRRSLCGAISQLTIPGLRTGAQGVTASYRLERAWLPTRCS